MFCHLTLRGRPAPKRTPEVVFTSSQLRLSSALPHVKVGGAGGAGSNSQSGTRVRFHSFCASLDMSLKDDFFFFQEKKNGASGTLRPLENRGVALASPGWCLQLNDAGTQRDCSGKLSSIMILEWLKSCTRLLGLWSGIHDWCELHVFVRGRHERKVARVYVLNRS